MRFAQTEAAPVAVALTMATGMAVLGCASPRPGAADGGSDAAARDATVALDVPGADARDAALDVPRDAIVVPELFVTITVPRDATLSGPSLDARWLASPGVTRSVCTLDGVALPCSGGGVALEGLVSGERVLSVEVFDDVGGSASDAVRWNVDADPPIVSVLTLREVGVREAQASWAIVDVSEVVAVSCSFDGVIQPCGAGASGMQTWADYGSGEHRVEVFATDLWGNGGASASPAPPPSARAFVLLSVP